MRYRLRTLLIVLAVGPVVLALAWWSRGIGIGLLAALALIAPMFALAAIAKVCLGAMEHRRG